MFFFEIGKLRFFKNYSVFSAEFSSLTLFELFVGCVHPAE